MTIAVLALQGAFIEHEHMLQKLGADTIELRKAGDLQKDFDGLILPGGESTVQGKLLHDLDMFEPLKEKICSGMPVLATCAGMILLASDIAGPGGILLRDSSHDSQTKCLWTSARQFPYYCQRQRNW